MKLSRTLINYCFIPILCVLPMCGLLSCTSQRALDTTSATFDMIGQSISDLPENVEAASPMLQKDLQNVWNRVAGQLEVVAEDAGLSEPPHPLAEAEQVRETLIAGASFNELLANASNNLETEDLQNINTGDIGSLNGILPFDIDLESCGENLAEVLNSLDVGQVSAVLQSEMGYHLIQLIDRNGGRIRIGHLVFEVEPTPELAEEPTDEKIAQEENPLQDAISQLASVLDDQ